MHDHDLVNYENCKYLHWPWPMESIGRTQTCPGKHTYGGIDMEFPVSVHRVIYIMHYCRLWIQRHLQVAGSASSQIICIKHKACTWTYWSGHVLAQRLLILRDSRWDYYPSSCILQASPCKSTELNPDL